MVPYENSERDMVNSSHKNVSLMSETECDDNQPDRSDKKWTRKEQDICTALTFRQKSEQETQRNSGLKIVALMSETGCDGWLNT